MKDHTLTYVFHNKWCPNPFACNGCFKTTFYKRIFEIKDVLVNRVKNYCPFLDPNNFFNFGNFKNALGYVKLTSETTHQWNYSYWYHTRGETWSPYFGIFGAWDISIVILTIWDQICMVSTEILGYGSKIENEFYTGLYMIPIENVIRMSD